MGPWLYLAPPQTQPYLKMAVQAKEVIFQGFSVLWGGKGLRNCFGSVPGLLAQSLFQIWAWLEADRLFTWRDVKNGQPSSKCNDLITWLLCGQRLINCLKK